MGGSAKFNARFAALRTRCNGPVATLDDAAALLVEFN
jgi:hypothetical protein